MKPQLLSALLITGVTAATGLFATPALAFNFTPTEEGEIDVGLGCYDTCIEPPAVFKSITSLVDSTTGYRSRLFVDDLSTKSVYNQGGSNQLTFEKKDAGTNWTGAFFRPSEYNEDTDTSWKTGQLEVGTFKFDFKSTLSELNIDFFDTESIDTTGILAVNGVSITDWLDSGVDGNVQSRTLFDVDSITLKFGWSNPDPNKGGDGVNFKMSGTFASDAATPEPFSMIGAGLALGAGAFLKNRKKQG